MSDNPIPHNNAPPDVATTRDTSNDDTRMNWFHRIRRVFLGIGILYILVVVLLCIPFFQRHTLYLNAIKLPLFADFNLPEKYGLAPNKTLNLRIPTPDGEMLGAWFILSDPYYHSLADIPTIESLPTKHIPVAVQKYPTILFLHGNAATRAFHVRVQHYTAFASRLGANVLAIDYRGFADSTGTPSEAGVVRDARAAWDWLIRKGVDSDEILIVGHSLGTGVGGGLAKELSRDGIACRGVVLLSPFSSIRTLLDTYHIFKLVPLIKPLGMIPWATNLLTWALTHKFDTLKAVPEINGPVLIAHAEDDWDIPDTHSDVLFNAFMDRLLPELKLPANAITASKAEYDDMTRSIKERKEKRDSIVKHRDMAGFGYVESFWDTQKKRRVTLVKTRFGGHDYLGVQEGVQDAIRKMFNMF